MKLLLRLREEVSKWIMRTKNAGVILRIPLLGVTAVSTLVTALRGTWLQDYTIAIVSVFGISALLFIWAYDRFQVMNIQNRWNADRADNYVGPTTAMNQLINARQFGVLSQALTNEWNEEKTQEELEKVTRETVAEFRNGIDLGDLDGN